MLNKGVYYWLLLGLFLLPQVAYGQQIINVNQTQPCFLNYTAGIHLWQNCGLDQDYIKFALLPWEWITGGNFTLVLVSVLIFGSYVKYQKTIYPILIGVMFLPISFFVFPDVFLTWAVVMAFISVGITVWYIFIKQTKEY